ncbi:dopamine receptor 2-like [Sipha flava]|uniref:Dopamine receptor 2-like n=1 Tax=Sipha flava TaxID=143950 RepID=A0A8B8G9I0_9HEMI|nr:dopamine receptor 2-like [Sipha flava]
MALLGALAAAGSGRQGCVLRVAADALSLYCGGGDGGGSGGEGDVAGGGGAGPDAVTDDDGDAVADYYLNVTHGHGGQIGDYFRPIRSVAIDDDGYNYRTGNHSAMAAVLANVSANVAAGLEPFLNGSYNHTTENADNFTNYLFVVTIGIILGAMILTTICGNALVIAAILLERNLQNVANYLIVSLAVADLMVACLVMPLGAVYEFFRGTTLYYKNDVNPGKIPLHRKNY